MPARDHMCAAVYSMTGTDLQELHQVPASVVNNQVVHYGHILSKYCDCQPRVEYSDLVPVIHHRRDV